MEQHLLESGQMIQTHVRGQCFGQWCAIHQPMPGLWEAWPRQWNNERLLVERQCPHGVAHPVAEMYDYFINTNRAFDLVHGCCSECVCGPRVLKRATETGGLIGVPDADSPVPAPATNDDQIPEGLGEIPEGLGENLVLEALALVVELWPRNNDGTIMITKSQWERLRRVLLIFPAMWTEVERKS
jgi:hypothetical protein